MHFRFIKNKLKLAASIAEIAALHASKKDQKTTGRAAELMDKAPGAAAKLKANGGEVMCLTVVEIFAVALRYFGKALKKGLKSSLVDQLRALINKDPGIYGNLPGAAPVAAALPAAAPVVHSSLLLEKRWMTHCKRTTHEKRPQVLFTDLLSPHAPRGGNRKFEQK